MRPSNFAAGLIRSRRPSVLEGEQAPREIEEQMARAQQNDKAVTVRTTSSSRGARTMSKPAMVTLGASVLALVWAGLELAGAGTTLYAYGFFFTEFFAGVVALVSLSLTVMLGLLATDRLVLLIRHRVLLQSAHRATGILAVAGLVFHVVTKVAIGRAAPTDAVVPFIGGTGLYVGLGTVAAFLMVSVLWTGLIRVRFAGVGPRWFWRALHSMAYVSWPFALIHGLNAGRAAKTWVVLSYLACVLLVVVALLVRLSVHLGRRSREQHQAAALNQAMTGRDEGRGRLAALTRR
ncbi:ferric reductase-like transmembrane domain-containing protein, partial [Micromonospora sp. NPDC003776]